MRALAIKPVASTMITLQSEKQELRKRIRSTLSKLSEEDVKLQSSLVTRHALNMSCVEKAKGASIFLSRPKNEVQTLNLCRELTKRGLRLFVPYMVPDTEREMEMLELHPGEDIRMYARDKWGIPVIPEPEKRRRATPDAIDIVFTPGVAFDLQGRRLGNGKGYYDTFFTKYDSARASLGLERVHKYGLALTDMVVLHVPCGEHDVILDGVITPAGVMSSMHV